MNNKTKQVSTQSKIEFLSIVMWSITQRVLNSNNSLFNNLGDDEKAAFQWLAQENQELKMVKKHRIPSLLSKSSLNKSVGKKLRVHRLKNKMSQAEMAERIGVSQAQYSRYEAGARIPVKYMAKIDALFDNKIRTNIQTKQLEDLFFQNQIHVPSDVLEKVRVLVDAFAE